MTRQLPLPLPHEPSFARSDFLASPENAAALALVDAWPRWPAPAMLIVGPPGAGKTHLAAVFAERAGARCLNGREFARLDADQAAQGAALALDDADAVGDAEATLFHLLNLARARGLSLLLTAGRAPDLWGVKTPDLLSRLRLAPLVALDPPEPALIEAVLTKLLADRQLSVDASVIAYSARRLDRSLDAARRFVDALDRETLAKGARPTRMMAAALLAGEPDGEEA